MGCLLGGAMLFACLAGLLPAAAGAVSSPAPDPGEWRGTARPTEPQLEDIWFDFPDPKGPLWGLVISTHLDYLANKIAVGTEHVAKVRKLIAKIYGPEAPFLVYFARSIILL